MPLRDEKGNIVKWYGTFHDIEDRKRAEDALKRSEAYLAHAQLLTKVGSWAYKPPDVREYWSAEMSRIFGIDPSVGDPSKDQIIPRVHPEDRQLVEDAVTQMFKDGRVLDVKYRYLRPDGQLRVIRSLGTPVFENGVVTRFAGACVDITDQEQRIEELRRNEFYLAEGQRIAHLGSWAFDPSSVFSHWSHELFQIYGLDPVGAAPTLAEYLGLVHPQDREFMAGTIDRMLAEASGCDVKKRIVRPDGEVRYIRCVGVPVVENGVLKRIVGTAMDVTEQEHLTQELRRREAYLAEAQRLSHTGSFGWSVTSGEIFWSEETFRIFEYDRATRPTLDLVLLRVHPDDRRFVEQVIHRVSNDGADFETEYRLLMPTGTVKYLHVQAQGLKDSSGDLEFVGAVTDVTATRHAEEDLRQALNLAFGERLSERTRIARELHDTLLQSFQGLMLHFQKARDLLPLHPAEAVQTLDRALERADQAITEGRDAIQDIRSSNLLGIDLAEAITALGVELAAADVAGTPAAFGVTVEGAPKTLRPILRDEIYGIAREALRNAFRHASASRIETDITYGEQLLRLRIRDNGIGIDPGVLDQGERAGHWGLVGMRERAKRLGVRLEVWSREGAGTEVEVSAPASIAYEGSSARSGFRLFRRKAEPDPVRNG